MRGEKRDVKICYIGGGSRNWAWVFMKDLAMEKDISGTIRLYDIDPEAAKANQAIGNSLMAERNPGSWEFQVADSLDSALEGSDFVLISILPGDFSEMAVDVHAPERFGIYQSVGDTVGPGGLVRSLRAIPMFQEIGRAIKARAPDAWVLNYTNPMTVCTRTLYREFPGIKAFGCCHEVFGTQKLLLRVIERAGLAATGEARREDLTTRVIGINHFTWIDRADWKGVDLFPLYADFAEKHAEAGFDEDGNESWRSSYFSSRHRVKFDLFRRYGLIAAAGDRHLAEFCPPSWYLRDPEHVESWKFSLTPVSFRIEQRELLKRRSAAYRAGTMRLEPEPSGEEGIRQIKALLGLGNLVTNVNYPNRGQMPDMPADSVVETNAFLSRDAVQPILTEGMPNAVRNLVLLHVENQEGILEAAMERNLEKAFRVFLNDAQVRKLDLLEARALFREMATKTLLPSYGYEPLP